MEKQNFTIYTTYRNGKKISTDFYLNGLEMKEIAFGLILHNGNIKTMDIIDGDTGELLITYSATRKISIDYDNGEF